MKRLEPVGAAFLTAIVLAGCVPTEMGPTVMAMPGQGKPFETFAQEQDFCRGYANNQVTPSRDEANHSAVGAAVIGTVLGAGLGAAIGGGTGAAIGAGSGALGGTLVGATNSSYGAGTIQQQYNAAFAQCMYAKGNQVAGFPAPVPSTPTITPTPSAGPAVSQASPPPPVGGTVTPVPLH